MCIIYRNRVNGCVLLFIGRDVFMENREKQIKEFFNDEKKFKALVNDDEFIGKVSGGNVTTETYKDELRKRGLEITTDEARQIQNTVTKIFETPTEKLDDEFLEDVAGCGGTDNNQYGSNENASKTVQGSSGSGYALVWGLGIGVPVAAWLASGIGCGVAASVYRKQGNKDKFHKCATAAFHILNAPLFPIELGGVLAVSPIISESNKSVRDGATANIKNFFTRPVESIFGIDVE